MKPNWELKNCCNHDQVVFLITISVCTVVILALWRTILLKPFKLVTVFLHEASHAIACKLTCGRVEGIQVHADEGGSTQTCGGIYWVILPAGYLGSSFWGILLILASTNLLTARIAAGCMLAALLIVLCVAKNWTLRGLCIGFIVFLGVIWLLQEMTKVKILRYVILFIGVMNSLFSIYDIYDDLKSRRVHSSDAEKFVEVCPCPCNGASWGAICHVPRPSHPVIRYWYRFYRGRPRKEHEELSGILGLKKPFKGNIPPTNLFPCREKCD